MSKARGSRKTRFINRRKRELLRKALLDAGNVETALDLPCGDGSNWPVFSDAGVSLVAAEISKGMLDFASERGEVPEFPSTLILTSVFDINLEDLSVDFAACMDFYPHLTRVEDRGKLLAEMGRVSRRYLALSVQMKPGIEDEIIAAGFTVAGNYDFFPVISNWRLYLLEKQV